MADELMASKPGTCYWLTSMQLVSHNHGCIRENSIPHYTLAPNSILLKDELGAYRKKKLPHIWAHRACTLESGHFIGAQTLLLLFL